MKMAQIRSQIIDNPDLGRGAWRAQDAYFQSRQHVEDGVDVTPPISPEHAKEAHQWNIELCKGDQSAMQFCHEWYLYCHLIDDICDSMRDGRPRMSREQIISTFFKAAILYNSSFFLANRELLFPIILETTLTYQISVSWEGSPLAHRRLIGDVFRTCGNKLYSMVALITGGEHHALAMTKKIHERDFLKQHDAEGNPI